MPTNLKPILYALAGAFAAVLVTATTALAGSGVGGVFNLGQLNTVDAQTILSGNPGANPLLKLVNGGSGAALRADSQTGIGVNGTSVSGTGQFAQSQSGIGLLGTHTNSTGVNAGVEGRTSSTDANGAGVVGKNTGGGPGLRSIVNAGAPPLLVNSQVKVVNLNADLLDGLDSSALPYWKLGGNAGTTPGSDFIGTSDNTALELKVNGQRALRIEPGASPNLIGGSAANTVAPGIVGATIGGGGSGGFGNAANGDYSAVAGGQLNTASGPYSTVAGGYLNSASGAGVSAVAGGELNAASGTGSAVAGGFNNSASGIDSAVAGGSNNTASGGGSAVAGGGGNTASGTGSAVAGGGGNTASGNYSFAAGRQAKATQGGSFVWGDMTSSDLTSPAANSFTVRASGGIWLGTNSSPAITAGHFIDTSTLGYLSTAGVWTDNSDRTLKHDFRPLDRSSVLEKIARMPITSWSYKAEEPSIRHIGPMAQDFYSAFGLGLDDKHIGTIDEGGVALAAIQGLYQLNKALRRANRTLEVQLHAQNARLNKLERAMSALSH
jgi:hypothetical protein